MSSSVLVCLDLNLYILHIVLPHPLSLEMSLTQSYTSTIIILQMLACVPFVELSAIVSSCIVSQGG